MPSIARTFVACTRILIGTMIIRHDRGKTAWIDIESPSEGELASILREFGIDERVREEMTSPTPLPLAIAFPGYAYLVLHFPVADPAGGTRLQELDIIIGKNFLITSRFEVIDPIYTLHKILEAEELLGTAPKRLAPGDLLEDILALMYRKAAEELGFLAERIERIEHDIFSGRERAAVRPISETTRTLLRYETALGRHLDPLTDFLAFLCAPAFFGTAFDATSARIEAARSHAGTLAASYRDVASELRRTNDSLLTASQNRIFQVLTVFSFVSYPPLLIAAIFAMETDLPLVHRPNDFMVVSSIMIGTAFAFFFIARKNRWL